MGEIEGTGGSSVLWRGEEDNSKTGRGKQGGGRRFDDGFTIRNGGAGFAGVFADFSGNRHRIVRGSVPPPARRGRGSGPGASVIGLRGLRFRNGRFVSSGGRPSRSAEGSRPPTVGRPSAATRRTPCRPLFYPLSSLQDPEDLQRPFTDDRPRACRTMRSVPTTISTTKGTIGTTESICRDWMRSRIKFENRAAISASGPFRTKATTPGTPRGRRTRCGTGCSRRGEE